MIRAIIFDIDGTLINSVDLHAEAWPEALRHFGHDILFERIRHQIGKQASRGHTGGLWGHGGLWGQTEFLVSSPKRLKTRCDPEHRPRTPEAPDDHQIFDKSRDSLGLTGKTTRHQRRLFPSGLNPMRPHRCI
jgi:FMN phosphatase YigB (HAD superfamily)